MSPEMNKEIKKIKDWLAVNKLSLDASKTKFMVVYYYQKVITDKNVPQLNIEKIDIERVKEFNFLGITIMRGIHKGSVMWKWRHHAYTSYVFIPRIGRLVRSIVEKLL